MIHALEWIGIRARWILAIGAIAALLLQDLAAVLRPALPAFVALMYVLSMSRVDLAAVFKRALKPRRIVSLVAICTALMIGTPTLVAAIGHVIPLPSEFVESMIYISAAPPLGSAAALCLLLGLDAALALELTIVGCFLAPLFGPFITTILIGEAVPIDPLHLSFRLGAMIGIGLFFAAMTRHLLGAETIARRSSAFDGVGAIAMLATIIPIFDGVTVQILKAPLIALGVLALVFVLNIGAQLLTTPPLRRVTSSHSAGALGLVWGNRNAALFMAALPPTPVLSLFIALYQFPMYMTPLLMKAFYTIKFNEKTS